jgi:hypothetical protein
MSLVEPDQPPSQPDDNHNESDRHQSIRERAYRLWQDAGSPADRDDEFWHQAETEIKNPPAPPPAKPSPTGETRTGKPDRAA